ncbi:hypothetical protein AC35_0050 [Escherichia coli 3-475-03_S3_C2]|uniref:PF12035 family protein n=1 Tax=Escherichia coli 4.0967 TaxID=869687 RepID=A0AAN4AHJ1_ECOLX|nr:hypothetical protein ECRM13516_6005 [Escherichia coli O145:H28 str. RM13516]AHY65625.1 hypothetical protein ECRM12761_12940 [Escherichia coli O145:H28 str. RM12761]APE91609.1 hypothetical protein FORC41_1782 [Escherichia coli]EDX41019.1 conserved hypothetical protein [Escherichia coli 101-1]EFI87933.1 hypothetical protein HMPREF9551_03057 [Escherichia coli MS 196-1]EFK51967.1 hypothetical protein HMPREF9345_01728 [Escherichia coli MS 107-1]EFU98764.1 hypothetical protein EC3431_1739 [Esche
MALTETANFVFVVIYISVSHSLPDATLPRLIRTTNPNRRSDKAFTPHPTNSA